MDWDRYKQLCDRPNVFSRWMLEQTGELVDADLAGVLARVRAGVAVPKPADHRGGAATDMFPLSLSEAEVARISECVAAAITAGRASTGTAERGLGGFREAWDDYRRALAGPGVQ